MALRLQGPFGSSAGSQEAQGTLTVSYQQFGLEAQGTLTVSYQQFGLEAQGTLTVSYQQFSFAEFFLSRKAQKQLKPKSLKA